MASVDAQRNGEDTPLLHETRPVTKRTPLPVQQLLLLLLAQLTEPITATSILPFINEVEVIPTLFGILFIISPSARGDVGCCTR